MKASLSIENLIFLLELTLKKFPECLKLRLNIIETPYYM